MRLAVTKSWWLAALLLQACGGSPVYFIAPIDGKVVEDGTGQPIEGAVVVANWQLVTGSLDGTRDKGQLKVLETVTDRDGRFHFDGFWKLNPLMYELRDADPRVIVFKEGYEHKTLVNHYPGAGTETPGAFRTGAADGATIRLTELRPVDLPHSPQRRVLFHGGLSAELGHLTKYAYLCHWKKIPRMILAMEREKRRLLTDYPNAWIDVVGLDDFQGNWLCGSVSEFFEEYKE